MLATIPIDDSLGDFVYVQDGIRVAVSAVSINDLPLSSFQHIPKRTISKGIATE
jgi:hypothetical protein